MEVVDTADLKSVAFGLPGSSPGGGTKILLDISRVSLILYEFKTQEADMEEIEQNEKMANKFLLTLIATCFFSIGLAIVIPMLPEFLATVSQ